MTFARIISKALLIVFPTLSLNCVNHKQEKSSPTAFLVEDFSTPKPISSCENDNIFTSMVPEAKAICHLFERVLLSRFPYPSAGEKEPKPVRRPVFQKTHGCALAKFSVKDDLPSPYRVGLFEEAHNFDALVRFSSDTPGDPNDHKNNTIGFGIKIFGVSGTKILEEDSTGTTQDFLLQNYNVFFVDTAQDFYKLFNNTLEPDKQRLTNAIFKGMERKEGNLLNATFWSVTPYQLGLENAAKYKLIPCKNQLPFPDGNNLSDGEASSNYLKNQLISDLSQLRESQSACFEFQVQIAKGDMAIDQATQLWKESTSHTQCIETSKVKSTEKPICLNTSQSDSEPLTVAYVTITQQNILENDARCENSSFTPWHSLETHRPLGSLNSARGHTYTRMANLRRMRNQIETKEP